MKHKKKVTQTVLDANRANSRSSTGPRTKQGKSNSSRNALRHGILARKVVLETHEQRAEFRELRHACKTEFSPKGLLEKYFVEEIATLFWKLGITEGLEAQELLRRQELSDDVGSIFHKDLELPISGYDLPLDRGWDVERMIVRAVSAADTTSNPRVARPGCLSGPSNQRDSKVAKPNSQKAR